LAASLLWDPSISKCVNNVLVRESELQQEAPLRATPLLGRKAGPPRSDATETSVLGLWGQASDGERWDTNHNGRRGWSKLNKPGAQKTPNRPELHCRNSKKFLQMTFFILLQCKRKKGIKPFNGTWLPKLMLCFLTFETFTETLLRAARDFQLKGLRREPSKRSSTSSMMTE
jgi:hypothetical protein